MQCDERGSGKRKEVTDFGIHYIYYQLLHTVGMPIDIERFERESEEELKTRGRTNAEEILAFLSTHPERAYTPKEIHEATDVARGSVGVVLSRLEERGLVRHRGEYWAVADVDDVDTTLSSMATSRVATDRLGSEDPEEWGPGVSTESERDE